MQIRPIRNDDELKWALSEVEQYFDNPPRPGTEEAERFDALTDIIEVYEDREYPIETPSSAEMLEVDMMINKKLLRNLACRSA